MTKNGRIGIAQPLSLRQQAISFFADDDVYDDIADGPHQQTRHHVDEGVLLDKQGRGDDDHAQSVQPASSPASIRPSGTSTASASAAAHTAGV